MSFDPLSAVLDLGKSVIERVWPDPIKQAEEVRKLAEIAQRGDMAELTAHVQLMSGQLKINEREAAHKSVFVAGWRPFIGWVGGMALAYQFVVYPLLVWVWAILKVKQLVPEGVEPPPVLDSGALFALVTSMLGVGAMRSHDKVKGVSHR